MSAIGSDRREYQRARSPDLVASLIAASGERSVCSVEDISAGGAKLVSSISPTRGERVKLQLTAPGREPLRVTGIVLRVEALGEGQLQFVAVRFDKLPDVIHETIRGIVIRALERTSRESTQT